MPELKDTKQITFTPADIDVRRQWIYMCASADPTLYLVEQLQISGQESREQTPTWSSCTSTHQQQKAQKVCYDDWIWSWR